MINKIPQINGEYPEYVLKILELIEKAGYEAYLVGGCVRDTLLSRAPGDYDIASSASPFDIMRIFNKTVPTGIKYGTVTVFIGENKAEVTTYRSENGYEDCRRPDNVSFVSSIKEDLSRRDFTVNAMAYSPKNGLYDPFGGEVDLNNSKIRCVGEPSKRFGEDALRILRAFRFAAQLDFTIDAKTLEAAEEKAVNIERISGERIFVELDKIFKSDRPQIIYDVIDRGCLDFLRERNKDYNKADFNGLNESAAIKWAVLFYTGALDFELTSKALHFSNDLKREVKAYLSCLSKPFCDDKKTLKLILSSGMSIIEIKNLLTLFKVLQCKNIEVALRHLEEIEDAEEPYNLKMLAIKGQDLIDIGIPSGAQCGNILNTLLNSVIENPSLNDRIMLIRTAKSLLNGH